MKFFMRLAVLFYVTLVLFLGAFLLLFVGRVLDFGYIVKVLYKAYAFDQFRLIVAITAGVMLFINFLFYRFCSVNVRRDKIIAFDNPYGRVSVSLMALEESARRAILRLDEIKEVKANIEASRCCLRCRMKINLSKEVNIPELTSRVQALVRDKIQDAIGLEEKIEVTVYVSKILPSYVNRTRVEENKSDTTPASEPNIPFRGYRI
ncbi:MAG: alkaline shock response membrane anchor protein AmaP [Candidatus Omnitrophica bacterium]|nr:alkaline shock response membrane anchor protein AmaP [Candidatus Omnitrophota bacterium]